MKSSKMLLLTIAAIISMVGSLCASEKNADQVKKLAHGMHYMALRCQTATWGQVQAMENVFLQDNMDATINQLSEATYTKFDGRDVVDLARASNCKACDAYANSIIKARNIALDLKKKKLGEKTLNVVLESKFAEIEKSFFEGHDFF